MNPTPDAHQPAATGLDAASGATPAPNSVEFRSGSAGETHWLGVLIGGLLESGDVVALCGALGAGKTLLAKGIAAGLRVPPDEPVVSPTFVIVRQYRGRERLYHLDAYRLAGIDELLALGFDEMLRDGVVVIEWADRVAPAIPRAALWIELEHVDAPEARLLHLRSHHAPRLDECRLRIDAARQDGTIR